MRLTNTTREAFIKAVMNDVPTTDYDEQAHKLAQDYLVERMPPKVRAIYDDKSLQHHLRTSHTNMPGALRDAYLYGVVGDYRWASQVPELWNQLNEMNGAKSAQSVRLDALRRQLKSVTASATTRAALAKALPEFEQYLPAEDAKSTNLPALANVVVDFVQAGWPKGKSHAQI